MEKIYFHSEDITFELSNQQKYVDWIFSFCKTYNREPEELSFVFCSDDYLLEINKKYLNHDYYTDIITFDYCKEKRLMGDIFISIDRVKENANNYDVEFDEELLRVLAHGVLHLIGFKDKTEEEQKEMRVAENSAIETFSQS